jgi:hypothetical protein
MPAFIYARAIGDIDADGSFDDTTNHHNGSPTLMLDG